MTKGYFSHARPSFIEGVSRIFDIGGTLNVYHHLPRHSSSDAEAMRSDWYVTGQDMCHVMGTYGFQFDLNRLNSGHDPEITRQKYLEIISGHGTSKAAPGQ